MTQHTYTGATPDDIRTYADANKDIDGAEIDARADGNGTYTVTITTPD